MKKSILILDAIFVVICAVIAIISEFYILVGLSIAVVLTNVVEMLKFGNKALKYITCALQIMISLSLYLVVAIVDKRFFPVDITRMYDQQVLATLLMSLLSIAKLVLLIVPTKDKK